MKLQLRKWSLPINTVKQRVFDYIYNQNETDLESWVEILCTKSSRDLYHSGNQRDTAHRMLHPSSWYPQAEPHLHMHSVLVKLQLHLLLWVELHVYKTSECDTKIHTSNAGFCNPTFWSACHKVLSKPRHFSSLVALYYTIYPENLS